MPNKLTDKELKIIMKATKAFNEIGIERYTKAGIFVGELLGIIDRLKAENERLKAEIKFSDYLEYETTNQIKAEAYKEFAEALTAKSRQKEFKAIYEYDIDNLLKELVGE